MVRAMVGKIYTTPSQTKSLLRCPAHSISHSVGDGRQREDRPPLGDIEDWPISNMAMLMCGLGANVVPLAGRAGRLTALNWRKSASWRQHSVDLGHEARSAVRLVASFASVLGLPSFPPIGKGFSSQRLRRLGTFRANFEKCDPHHNIFRIRGAIRAMCGRP